MPNDQSGVAKARDLIMGDLAALQRGIVTLQQQQARHAAATDTIMDDDAAAFPSAPGDAELEASRICEGEARAIACLLQLGHTAPAPVPAHDCEKKNN